MTCAFEMLFDNPGRPRPENLLPVALGYLRGAASRTRILFDRAGRGAPLQAGPVGQFLDNRDFSRRDAARLLIGPPAPEGSYALAATRRADGDLGGRPQVVIIDIGTAFWHPRFRRGGVPLFEQAAFMQFGGQGGAVTQLSADAIAEYADLFDRRGNAAVLDALARDFPESIYGRRPGAPSLRPGDFAHGTAMCDLVLHGPRDPEHPEAATGRTADPEMTALDLPASAYLDRTGDVLHGTVLAAIDLALEMTRDSDPRLILLPFAYLRSPFPAPQGHGDALSDEIEARLGRANAALYLPMGNFRQSQLHARAADSLDADRWSEPLVWQLPVADPSPNTVVLSWTGSDRIELRLRAPDGTACALETRPGQAWRLDRSGTTIGAVHCFGPHGAEAGPGRRTLRLALARTQVVRGAPDPAPAGQWTIEVRSRTGLADLHMTILRDDPPALNAAFRHNRQSFFVDPRYRRRGADGRFEMDDDPASGARIRRAGTASHLVLGRLGRRIAVGAREAAGDGSRVAPYSGAFAAPGDAATVTWAEVGSSLRPRVVSLRNGSNGFGAVSGTSAAAALALHADLAGLT